MPQDTPHMIRLRGPWRLAAEGDLATEVRGKVGESWTNFLDSQPCKVLYCRHFNRPTNLTSTSSVWLSISEFTGVARVQLNGTTLCESTPADCPLRIDITQLLNPGNELHVEVSDNSRCDPIGLTGEVRLEVFD